MTRGRAGLRGDGAGTARHLPQLRPQGLPRRLLWGRGSSPSWAEHTPLPCAEPAPGGTGTRLGPLLGTAGATAGAGWGWHSPAAAPGSFPALRSQTLQDAVEEALIAQVVEARSNTASSLPGHANLMQLCFQYVSYASCVSGASRASSSLCSFSFSCCLDSLLSWPCCCGFEADSQKGFDYGCG